MQISLDRKILPGIVHQQPSSSDVSEAGQATQTDCAPARVSMKKIEKTLQLLPEETPYVSSYRERLLL